MSLARGLWRGKRFVNKTQWVRYQRGGYFSSAVLVPGENADV